MVHKVIALACIHGCGFLLEEQVGFVIWRNMCQKIRASARNSQVVIHWHYKTKLTHKGIYRCIIKQMWCIPFFNQFFIYHPSRNPNFCFCMSSESFLLSSQAILRSQMWDFYNIVNFITLFHSHHLNRKCFGFKM